MNPLNPFKERRTVRNYSDQDIPQELLNELLECACRASTTGNMQLYSVVVSRSAEEKAALAPAHFNQPTVTTAPVVLTFCADFNRFMQWCKLRHADAGYDNFQSFTMAAIDALLVAQQFCSAAEQMGLGICYLGTTTYNARQIIEQLSLPKFVVPITTVTVGYPAAAVEQVERLPLAAVVHEGSYTPYSEECIEQLYREKEELAVNRAFVAENQKENLAQVFTDVRYTRESCEHFSKEFMEVIREQGFFDYEGR